MKRRRWQQGFLAVTLALGLGGCFWGNEYETRHLIGNYYLCAVEPNAGTWSLHFDDEEFGLGDNLLASPVVEAGFNKKYLILRVVGPAPQLYVIPVSTTENREAARRSIIGPLTLNEFQTVVRRVSGNDLPTINPALTKAD
jgi:hypothetical protein